MIVECPKCHMTIKGNIGFRFTAESRKLPTALQGIHFRFHYEYVEFPILGNPVKVKWVLERCNGIFKLKKGDVEE